LLYFITTFREPAPFCRGGKKEKSEAAVEEALRSGLFDWSSQKRGIQFKIIRFA